MIRPKVDIFKYDNFRSFLQDIYESKKNSEGFTFRSFSAKAGYKSPNFLKMVIQGLTKLSDESIKKFSIALDLNENETKFFGTLVNFNQASSTHEKLRLVRELVGFKKFGKSHPLILSEFTYFSKWYYVPIRELVKLGDFQEDPTWIAKRISPRIHARQVIRALNVLKKLGLLGYDKEGKLIQTHAALAIAPEVSSALYRAYHREMISRGSESIELFESKHREISATTIAVSKKNFDLIREKIRSLRKEVAAMTDADELSEQIYQLNFQFFPLTDPGAQTKKDLNGGKSSLKKLKKEKK